jgi:hypothetical protein
MVTSTMKEAYSLASSTPDTLLPFCAELARCLLLLPLLDGGGYG